MKQLIFSVLLFGLLIIIFINNPQNNIKPLSQKNNNTISNIQYDKVKLVIFKYPEAMKIRYECSDPFEDDSSEEYSSNGLFTKNGKINSQAIKCSCFLSPQLLKKFNQLFLNEKNFVDTDIEMGYYEYGFEFYWKDKFLFSMIPNLAGHTIAYSSEGAPLPTSLSSLGINNFNNFVFEAKKANWKKILNELEK